MGTDCAQCPSVLGWNNAVQQVKDHKNRFPLFGAHAAVQCEDCHKGAAVGPFQGLSTECLSCHFSDFNKTTNPNHPSAGKAFDPVPFPTVPTFASSFGARLSPTPPGLPHPH